MSGVVEPGRSHGELLSSVQRLRSRDAGAANSAAGEAPRWRAAVAIEGCGTARARRTAKKGGQTPRTVAARAVGLSEAQTRNVVRLARIPVAVAEAKIEAIPPPTEAALLRIAPTDPKFNGNTFCGSAAYTTLVRSQSCLAMFAYWCQKN